MKKEDILRIPFIKVNDEINYDELCGREIKNSDFILCLKEENKEQTYFALKVDNAEVLVQDETEIVTEEIMN